MGRGIRTRTRPMPDDILSDDTLPDGRPPTFLRLSLGYVYLHFGFLKFFPDLSPAELLATQTVMAASGHVLDAAGALLFLAILECAIGVVLIFGVLPRLGFVLFLLHMAGTFLPLVLLPELCFKFAPFAPTVEGQYVFKNIVFVAAGWTVLRPHVFPRRRRGAAHTVRMTPSLPSRTGLQS